jgi:hypothetical protein
MLMSPRVLAEVPGVSLYHQVLLIGTRLARRSSSDDGFEVGWPCSPLQSSLSVGLSARQTTCQPSRSF